MAKEYIEERNGGYYLASTRISLDSIVQCFNEGLSPEAILGEFDTLNLYFCMENENLAHMGGQVAQVYRNSAAQTACVT
jgi:hypothetical protein